MPLQSTVNKILLKRINEQDLLIKALILMIKENTQRIERTEDITREIIKWINNLEINN